MIYDVILYEYFFSSSIDMGYNHQTCELYGLYNKIIMNYDISSNLINIDIELTYS
jgi:hypothetical protein